MRGRRLRDQALVAAAAALLIAAAATCGGGATLSPSPSSTASPSVSPTTATPTPTATPTMQLSVYFLRDGKVAAAHRQVPQTQGVAAAAFRELLAGPTAVERAAGLSSALAADIRILGIRISGGTAVADVGGGLVAAGDAQRTLQRLAQLTYTATQFRTVQRVLFLQDGDPLAVEGSGMDFTKPASRASFESLTPAIFVEAPAVGDQVTSPLFMWGTANTFEATFWAEVQTPAGKVLVKKVVTATSGSGTRGTFRVRLPFHPTSEAGRLVVYERSMADGSRINVVIIPLVFAR